MSLADELGLCRDVEDAVTMLYFVSDECLLSMYR